MATVENLTAAIEDLTRALNSAKTARRSLRDGNTMQALISLDMASRTGTRGAAHVTAAFRELEQQEDCGEDDSEILVSSGVWVSPQRRAKSSGGV